MNGTRTIFAVAGFWGCVSCVVLAFLWHLSVGAKAIPISTIWSALINPQDGFYDHIVIRDLRLPRTMFAMTVGAALSVAGALMQGVTRNPLAEPGILGLVSGASFAVIIGIGWFDLAGSAYVPLFAALGALGGATIVWIIASAAPGGATPLTLILTGTAITGFLLAVENAALLLDEETFETYRIWLTGSLSGRDFKVFLWALPWFGTGFLAAIVIARQVTALAMGDETAAGLGVDTVKIKCIALGSVVMLTAAAVSVAGPLGFVGLVVPHVVRMFVGSDYRLILPFSALTGAGYVLVVDVAARMILAPAEISTGIVTTMLGAPIFIWLVRVRL